MRTRTFFFLLLLCIFSLTVMGQSFSLSELEIQTTGYIPENENTPVFSTTGIVAGRFIPAHWLRLRASTYFYIPDTVDFFYKLNDSTDPGRIIFDGIDLTFPNIHNSSWSLIIFTGRLDNPASDSLLREHLKVSIDEPEFHGLPSGMAFSPEGKIHGTGIGITGIPGNANVVTGFYGYWNDSTGSDMAGSFDVRLGLSGNIIVATFFGGATLVKESGDTTFRTGISSLVHSGQSYEIYAEAGLRQFDANSSKLGKNMYLLFEPRIYLEKTDLALSFFSSPLFPENAPNHVAVEAENNLLGINFLIAAGSTDYHKKRGGVSFLACMDPDQPGKVTPLSFSISPFYTVRISDYTLDITAVIKPLHLDKIREAGEIRLLFKAVY